MSHVRGIGRTIKGKKAVAEMRTLSFMTMAQKKTSLVTLNRVGRTWMDQFASARKLIAATIRKDAHETEKI
jgi:hypothetical protein